MPRELITIQVGQCGNQIGRQFWNLALQEHAQHRNNQNLFDDSMSTFFRNVDSRYSDPVDLPFQNGTQEIKCLKARAILVDMDEGPVAETMTGPIRELFDDRQFITDVSGSGNNWAHGHCLYGPQYKEKLLDQLHRATELCDSLQSFFLMHSLGGGTGSGLGTYILGILQDHYPDVYRFVTAVFPSENDDVVTSPYNSVLSMRELNEHADCVLPIENQALLNIVQQKINSRTNQMKNASASSNAFADMNNIVAHLLTNLTCSMRFEGSLNIDLNEITTNLVPYPKLHYLMTSMSPLLSLSDPRTQPRRFEQMFTDVFQRENHLITTNPRSGTMLACGLLLRGNVQVSDINRNIQRIQKDLRMIYWNKEGFKVGVCDAAPVGMPSSLLCISNNCNISDNFINLRTRFLKLYRRKAHLHHYTEYADVDVFNEALESLNYIVHEYSSLNTATPPTLPRRRRCHPLL